MTTEFTYPYVLLASAPIGPIALDALTRFHYPPVHVITDPSLSSDALIEEIEAHNPTFLLVVGFGAILKQKVLDTVSGQVINIHPSYLPEYRGPAPVVQTILDGVTETGVTVMEIDRKMDHGPILEQERIRISGTETPDELYTRLTIRGVELFMHSINDYLEDRLDPLPQDETDVSITHFVKKEDGELTFSLPADYMERMVRAYQGWPRTWFMHEGKRLLVDKAVVRNDEFVPVLVQPENGKQMTFEAYCAGQRKKPEAVLTELQSQNP